MIDPKSAGIENKATLPNAERRGVVSVRCETCGLKAMFVGRDQTPASLGWLARNFPTAECSCGGKLVTSETTR